MRVFEVVFKRCLKWEIWGQLEFIVKTWLYLMKVLLMILGWWYQYEFITCECQEISKLDF